MLLSATTVAGAVSGLAAAVIEGLEGTGIRLAWTVLSEPGQGLPSWVSAGPGRQGPLIDAAAAVICGGGHGILAKALIRGTPVVTVPGGGEQWENAARIRRAGLGVRLIPQFLTPARMAKAVFRVLEDPRFAAAATSCVPARDAATSGDRACDVIERLMAVRPRSARGGTTVARVARPLRRRSDPVEERHSASSDPA